LISHLGYPPLRPNHQIFGTTCLMDSKNGNWAEEADALLQQHKDLVESHLEILIKAKSLQAMRHKYSKSLKKIHKPNKILQLPRPPTL
jgi:hypothetical protein